MNLFRRKKEIPELTPLEAYNRWAPTYSQEKNPVKELSDSLVEKWIPADLSQRSFLDAGCGTGKFCDLAIGRHALKVVGIDLSPAMIKIAEQRCPQASFFCGDLLHRMTTDESFDCVLCALVLGHVPDLNLVLGTLLTKVKAGGSIIITDFHPHLTLQKAKRTFRDSASGTVYEVSHHLHLFADYFRVVRQNNSEIVQFEEPCYNGTPVVFGIHARKLT